VIPRATGVVGIGPPLKKRFWFGSPGALILGGIGDFLVVEARMTDADRASVEGAYYAAPAQAEHEVLMRSLVGTAFPNLRQHTRIPNGKWNFGSKAHAERIVGKLPAGVEDWSIGKVFPRRRPFAGSSFLRYTVANPTLPDGPFVVVVPHSTWGQWRGRNFDGRDWQVCLEFLEARGLYGVVLCREQLPVPHHARLLDWQGKTTILETVELVKAAEGYVGIDSALSCLAAMRFPAERLSVKGFNSFLLTWAEAYYGPHRAFPFLRPTLEAPAWS
jgi:hypothetical protein